MGSRIPPPENGRQRTLGAKETLLDGDPNRRDKRHVHGIYSGMDLPANDIFHLFNVIRKEAPEMRSFAAITAATCCNFCHFSFGLYSMKQTVIISCMVPYAFVYSQ